MQILQEQKPHFSLSQMRTMLSCPYKYYLKYIEQRNWDYVPSAVMFGGVMHEVLAEFNCSLMNGNKMDKQALINNFKKVFAFNADDDTVLFKNNAEPNHLFEKGQKLLKLYVQKFSNMKPSEVETEFRLPIIDSETGEIASYDIVGKMDLITDETMYEIKTSGRRMSTKKVESNLQLLLYGWAYRQIYGQEPKELGIINLVKTKKPKIQVLKTKLNDHKQKVLISVIFKLIKAIGKEEFYPNLMTAYGCDYCTYSMSCKYNF